MNAQGTGTENTSRSLIVLLCIFFVLIVGIVLFSGQLVPNIANAAPGADTLALLVVFALPAALLVIVAGRFVRLFRQRAQRLPGAGLKLRMTAFFLLVALLSSGPQLALGVTFINSAMGTWFQASTGEALREASKVALDAWQEKVDNLRAFSGGSNAAGLAADFASAPDRTWNAVQGWNRGIAAVQLFTSDGREVAFRGDERARVSDLDLQIASIALHRGATLVSHNRRHFERIAGLKHAGAGEITLAAPLLISSTERPRSLPPSRMQIRRPSPVSSSSAQ